MNVEVAADCVGRTPSAATRRRAAFLIGAATVISGLSGRLFAIVAVFQFLRKNILCHICFTPSSPNALIAELLPRTSLPEFGHRNVSWLFAAKIQARMLIRLSAGLAHCRYALCSELSLRPCGHCPNRWFPTSCAAFSVVSKNLRLRTEQAGV